jgi:CBS domain-containing protein
MSARAAARLEWMGFDPVYEYADGKSDWFAAGLERAGEYASVARIGDFAQEAVTCSPDESVSRVRTMLSEAGAATCVVLNDRGVVLGAIRRGSLAKARDGSLASDIMHPGPKTYRADYTLEDPLEWMEQNRLSDTIVTSPDGRLLGIAPLEPVRRYMEEFRRRTAAASGR